jgi:Bacterial Ig-like domain (group 2)
MATFGCGGASPANPPGPHPATNVIVTPSQTSVYQGMTAQFQAQVTGQNNQAVTWAVSPEGLGSIDSTGLYTAPRDAYGGPFNISATSKAVPNAVGTSAVTILPPQVAVTPAIVTLPPSATEAFTATVSGVTNTNVNWTVSEAGGGSISNSGLYHAPATTGFYHAIATSVADTTLSGSATVTVSTSSASFTPTGNMQHARGLHTATLLPSGKVLITGGGDRSDRLCIGGLNSAELYDSSTGTFTATGSMAALRYAHTATLLLDGKVLVAGGYGSGFDCSDLGIPTQSSAELYDLSNGTFKGAGSMFVARGWHTATLLQDGRVLLVGGAAVGGQPYAFGQGLQTAEIYNPVTGTFASTGNLPMPLYDHTATLLSNGRVLITGGMNATDPNSPIATAAAEIYDPATGVFTTISSMHDARARHGATLLTSGHVLITGGSGLATSEIFDPATNSFSRINDMGRAREGHTATLLSDGSVLIAGGGSGYENDPTAEVYDPATASFSTTGSMETGRYGHTATLLKNGTVIVAGSVQGRSFLASVELYK